MLPVVRDELYLLSVTVEGKWEGQPLPLHIEREYVNERGLSDEEEHLRD